MTQDEIVKNISKITVGPDDTFRFHCTQCGKCCINRSDILLSPRDIYKASKHLGLTPLDFFQKYCETYIGDHSGIPIVRLKPVGSDERCPLLKKRKCLIHAAKPSVCAMYPLGRYMEQDKEAFEAGKSDAFSVRYLLKPIDCGTKSETHTVREWLSGFNIEIEDKAFISWYGTISKISHFLNTVKEIGSERVMGLLYSTVLGGMYLNYDIEEEYQPQFDRNLETLMDLMDKLSPFTAPLEASQEATNGEEG